ncbi:MAG: DapH/DapD/GlmU-related protein [Gammaproteobacteria bacterium]|nr:DapH/DapD/GlmU-related protein [Gammaproteobacteria bacterium]
MRGLLTNIIYTFLRLFYRNLKGADPLHVFGIVFFMQKIVGFNRLVPWPVHFTSRVIHHNNIKVGVRSFPGFSQGCYIQGRNGIVIGNNLRMGPGVGLISANHNKDDYDRWDYEKPIYIGDNVWLGMNVVVLPGVRIGSNVIIGANSVVSHDILSNAIAIGNPCEVVREKFPYQGVDYASI